MQNATMKRARHAFCLAAAAVVMGAMTAPASAQDEDYERIVTIMRACAQIGDVMARVTCYDNNIGAGSVTAIPSPGRTTPPTPSGNEDAGFGAEMLPQERERRLAARPDEVSGRVSNVSELEPGIFLLTLNDGAQWRFVDSAPFAYDPPRAGDTIELERGSLGSVFLTAGNQRRLRVRRVR